MSPPVVVQSVLEDAPSPVIVTEDAEVGPFWAWQQNELSARQASNASLYFMVSSSLQVVYHANIDVYITSRQRTQVTAGRGKCALNNSIRAHKVWIQIDGFPNGE